MNHFLALFLVSWVLTSTAPAQSLADVEVGHWVQIKGVFGSDGVMVAEEVELRPAEKNEVILSSIGKRLSTTRFLIHGQELHTSEKTRLRKISLGGLVGERVKIEGRWKGPRNFSCRSISLRDPGRDRIVGRVDAIDELSGGARSFRVMSFDVRASAETAVEVESSLEQLELIAPRFVPQAKDAGRRDDDDDLPGTIRLSENLTFGGQLEWKSDRESNYDLDADSAEDRTDHAPSLRGEVVYRYSEDLYFLGGFRQTWLFRNDEDRSRRSDANTRLNEAYGYWRNVRGLGVDLQIGRQDFDEQREWLYDQNLDAVRVIVDRNSWRGEFSYSTTLSGGSPLDESARNWIAYVSNNDRKRHLAAYWIDRNNRRDSGGHPVHFGVRALGEWFEDHLSWAEFAVLRGETGGRGNSGYGFDLGSTWSPNGKDSWNFTAGYAMGSGDSSAAGTNGNFAQTGLNDNNGRLLGVTSFRYYGELVDPELSNLSILTLGVGRRLGTASSIDLLLHKYDQVEAFASRLDANIDRNPDGVHRDLGWELDLVFGSRAFKDWSFEVVLGAFHPGAAYPGADDAWLARFQVRYLF